MLVFADVLEHKNKLLFYNHKVKWVRPYTQIHKAEGTNIKFDYNSNP